MALKHLVLLAAFVAPSSAMAQESWEYKATVYGWFVGASTTADTPLGEVEGEVDFEEIWDDLNIGFEGAFEARKGRWSLISDLQYYDLTIESPTPAGAPFDRVEIDEKLTIISGYATYAVIDNQTTRLDLGGGVRYIDGNIDTRFLGDGTTPDASFSSDGSWADLLLVARVDHAFNDRWFGLAYADAGGFGIGDSSELSWQAFAGGGYRFNETWSTIAGYRHLSVDRDYERTTNNTTEFSGPLLGLQVAF